MPDDRPSKKPGDADSGKRVRSRRAATGIAGLQPGLAPESAGDPAWNSRGYMPHFDTPHAVQHVTFHLSDSLPRPALERMEAEARAAPQPHRARELFARVDAWLDAGHGCCALKHAEAAALVQSALLHFDAVRYKLVAWVIMPNHVHVLFEPIAGWTMARIVASWKSWTGRRLASLRTGTHREAPVWQREYWDRYIRDEQHLETARQYIHRNPVKAGLAAAPERWRWSSAYVPA